MKEGSFQSGDRTVDHALDSAYFIDDTATAESEIEIEEMDVSRIPLPDALPQKLDFKNLPHQVLRSATIDSLLQQNEDLMVRLKVQIRRNADLEEQVQSFKDSSSDVFHEIDRLKDELLIYKEKDRLFAQRNETTEQQLQQLKSKIQFLETQYAELYSAAREKQHKLSEANKLISRHTRYRKALLKVAKNYRSQNVTLTELYTQEKTNIKDLQVKLGDAVDRIQFLNRQHKEDQAHLTESYESQLSGLSAQLKAAQTEMDQMHSIAQQVEDLKDQKITWENERVRLERQISTDRESASKHVRELQEAVAGYRQDAKEKSIKIKGLETDLSTLNESLSTANSTQQALTEQVESLQCLWRDNQNQIDKKDSQIDSLQKLNQQLSQQINSLRKENSDLKNRSENHSFKAEERIKELDSQVKILGKKKVQSENQRFTLKKIEELVAEIQSGFKFKSPEELSSQESSSSISKPEDTTVG